MLNELNDEDPLHYEWSDWVILAAFVLTMVISTLLALDVSAGLVGDFFERLGLTIGTRMDLFFTTIGRYWGLTE